MDLHPQVTVSECKQPDDHPVESFFADTITSAGGVTIRSSAVGFGRLGIGGDLGLNALTTDVVIHPELTGDKWEFLAAHAPSRIEITTQHPVLIRGFLNASAWYSPANPVEFWVNDNSVGGALGPCDTTVAKPLMPGSHKLDVICLGANNHGRHSVWAIKPAALLPECSSGSCSPDRLAVITIACYPDRMAKDVLRPLAISASRKRIDLHVFGVDEPFQHFGYSKVHRLHQWIAGLPDRFRHVLYVDARDVVFQGDLPEICEAFDRFKSQIVIGTEQLPWPVRHPDYAKLFPRLANERNYPSAGVFMGERTSIQTLLERFERLITAHSEHPARLRVPEFGPILEFQMTEYGEPTINDDQYLWHIAYLNKLMPITADAEGRLITNVGGKDRTLMMHTNTMYSIRGRRLCHQETGYSPPILHFPGVAAEQALHPWAGYLGLI